MLGRYKNFANAIRCLSMDMVESAGSGHQGVCLGFADVMSVLYQVIFKQNVDRFVLSNGHASAMLYSTIYLSGNPNITIDDLKNFRKFKSKTQGHPERNLKLGIGLTTGALGQGLASAVGVAIALKKKDPMGDARVYVSVGDGDLMEGISHESMSMAASLNLNNLIVLFDDNDVCIDGHSSEYTTKNIERFRAYGFSVYEVNGHNYFEIENIFNITRDSLKPVFIAFKTVIGRFSKHEGAPLCHGKFLGRDEIRDIRASLGFSPEPFSVPDGIMMQRSKDEFECKTDQLSIDIKDVANSMKQSYIKNPVRKSTRVLCGECLSKFAESLSDLMIGGSADLSDSTCCISANSNSITRRDFSGNYIHYGIREHAMSAIMSGLSSEGVIPYAGTFLVFSDYMRPAIRNAAIMNLGNIYIFTHDSIAVGSDGATHQPVEHIASLRAIPNLYVFRPACDIEVVECLELAIMNRKNPSAMILSRQNVDCCVSSVTQDKNMCAFGMYEIYVSNVAEDNNPATTIIATGSEVGIALKMARDMRLKNNVRVVSAPCLELFEQQSESYKKQMLGDGPRIIIEAGVAQPWYKYVNSGDSIISVETFGESGTEDELYSSYLKNVKI